MVARSVSVDAEAVRPRGDRREEVRRFVMALGQVDRGAAVPLDVLECSWILDARTAPAIIFANGGMLAAGLVVLAQDFGLAQDVVPETLVSVAAAECDGDHRGFAERLLRMLDDTAC
ncbi:hypothetical protein [Sphingomonas corticis]|uniref:Uncharacterized protein n=1 Tax=Sphingomonas corticis TaxID=2722791 RepID=A0ABX1CTC2_9SPHN|nr:hypothetical protein [Sphingomonas corticis]NJR80051.1 hypothetical protein [Sphingomonas corticis]